MGWELITVMALQAIRNPLPAADTEQEVSCWLWSARWYRLYLCHSAWEMPGISEGFPGPPLQAVFHKMPASFLFVQRFAVRTICSLSQCSGVLQAAPGHLGWNAQDPAKMGLSLPTLDSQEPLLPANFCHSSVLARYWLWSIRLFLYSFLLQNRYWNSLRPVRLLWDILRNTISDPNSPFLYPQGNAIEIVSGLSLCSKIICLIIREKHFVKINRNLNIFS